MNWTQCEHTGNLIADDYVIYQGSFFYELSRFTIFGALEVGVFETLEKAQEAALNDLYSF